MYATAGAPEGMTDTDRAYISGGLRRCHPRPDRGLLARCTAWQAVVMADGPAPVIEVMARDELCPDCMREATCAAGGERPPRRATTPTTGQPAARMGHGSGGGRVAQ